MHTARPAASPIARHTFSFQVYMVNGLTYSPPDSTPDRLLLPQATSDEQAKIMSISSEQSLDAATSNARLFLTAFMEKNTVMPDRDQEIRTGSLFYAQGGFS